MRINRNMLLNIANDTVEKSIKSRRTLLAVYLQGSLLGDSPLIGNTADIDLFFIHTDEVKAEREIIRVSDEVHLDISHHPHKVYRAPRELRVHPWLGPAVYGCKIMYDPQHFMDFVQASVRGQFDSPVNVLARVRKQAIHAREIWESFDVRPHLPEPQDVSLYLHALEHVANSVAGLHGPNLTERRFTLDLPARTEAVGKPGLYQGFLGLLGASMVDMDVVRSWLPDWAEAYSALSTSDAPLRLHPYRWLYYERAVNSILEGPTPSDALWPLWRTWTHTISAMPGGTPHTEAWQKAGLQLGLLGEAFSERIAGLDAYLDMVDEVLENWARQNGV